MLSLSSANILQNNKRALTKSIRSLRFFSICWGGSRRIKSKAQSSCLSVCGNKKQQTNCQLRVSNNTTTNLHDNFQHCNQDWPSEFIQQGNFSSPKKHPYKRNSETPYLVSESFRKGKYFQARINERSWPRYQLKEKWYDRWGECA